MPREKFRTLTEQMFYTLLCLKEECYGMDILDRVPAMTGQRGVQACTQSELVLDLLEQFLEAGMIRETKVDGRKRSYLLTDRGQERLDREYERICAQALDYRKVFGKECGLDEE